MPNMLEHIWPQSPPQLSEEITSGSKYKGDLKNAEPETGFRKQRHNQGQTASHLRPWNKML